MNRHRWPALCGIVAALVTVEFLLPSASPQAPGPDKDPPSKAEVYVYPAKLTAKDKLWFGPGTEPKETIPIKGDATLVYVDLMPGGRFAHPTQCVLISTEGAQVLKGRWPLVLNGKELFRDGKKYKVGFPVNLAGK